MSGADLPLRALAVFDAAARAESFRAAADELHLTPSAVSHQIRSLEQRLGFRLFERAGRGVALTRDGGAYYKAIRDSFRKLRRATQTATRRAGPAPRVEVVRIQTPPSLASQWLLPRLPAFLAAHPAIDIRVSAEAGRYVQGADLAIVYGTAQAWAAQAEPFLAETVQPLCAPQLLAGRRLRRPRDLLPLTLIRSRGNFVGWEDWLARHGLKRAAYRAIEFDPSHVAIDAAVKGLGVVLESNLLTEDDVAAGRLVAPLPATAMSGLAYWIVVPRASVGRRSVEAVRHWLLHRRGDQGGRTVSKPGSITIYGIKNCDTMKKARAWLDQHGVAYSFHDYKASGIERARLEAWAKQVGWETLLNRAGTTFRKLPDQDKAGLTQAKAIALMLEQPSMIKRPVLDHGGRLLVGFKPADYQAIAG